MNLAIVTFKTPVGFFCKNKEKLALFVLAATSCEKCPLSFMFGGKRFQHNRRQNKRPSKLEKEEGGVEE